VVGLQCHKTGVWVVVIKNEVVKRGKRHGTRVHLSR